MPITIPENAVYQYLEKDHLDIKVELNQEEWISFVDEYQDTFVDACTELGRELFAQFLKEKN